MSRVRPLDQLNGQLAFKDDALVYFSQFHNGRTSARLVDLAAHSIRANALSFLQCRDHSFNSRWSHQLYKYRVGRCFTAGDSLGSGRECREGLVLFAYFVNVLYESPEDPCKVFLPSEFTFGVTSSQGAVFFCLQIVIATPFWKFSLPALRQCNTCRGSRHCSPSAAPPWRSTPRMPACRR